MKYILIALTTIIFSQRASAILTEDQFIFQCNQFEKIMSTFTMKSLNIPGKINKYWESELRPLKDGGAGGANASGTSTSVGANVVGGLVRTQWIGQDELDFILCHELGHSTHMGRDIVNGSDENSADHFAVISLQFHPVFEVRIKS